LFINQKAHNLNVVGNKQVTKQAFLLFFSGLSDVKDKAYFSIVQNYHLTDVSNMIAVFIFNVRHIHKNCDKKVTPAVGVSIHRTV